MLKEDATLYVRLCLFIKGDTGVLRRASLYNKWRRAPLRMSPFTYKVRCASQGTSDFRENRPEIFMQ
jgi:hypothetical protein